MTAAWQSYPGAPDPGARICTLAEIGAAGVFPAYVAGFGILVLYRRGAVSGFVNACPHQYLPLDHRASDILTDDGARLVCSNHDATFDADSGAGIGGHGIGCNLDPIPLEIKDGTVLIART